MKIREKAALWLLKGTTTVSPKNPYLRMLMNLGVDGEENLTRPYVQHPVFYAGVRAKARNIAQVPFRLYVKGSDVPFERENHPLVRLFDDVNPLMSKYQLWEAAVTCLDIWGEAFIVKDRELVNGVPAYLWPQNPSEFKEQFRGTTFVGWEYTKNGKHEFIFPDEVIQPKYYNPYDSYRGLSPLKAMDTGLKADWSAIKYNKKFFDNDGTPGSVFSTDQNLTDPQYERLRAELIDSRRGTNNAFRGMLLDGGVKLANATPSNHDMQFLENRKFSREEIAMILGVPKPELQLYEDINYATSRSADLSFWKKTLLPLMRMLEEKYNTDLLSPLGFEGHFDTSGIDVLNEDLVQKAEAAAKFWQMGVPFMHINERLSLGFSEFEGWDMPKVQGPAFGASPSGDPDPGKDPLAGKSVTIHGDREPKKIDDQYATKELRAQVWKSKIRPVLPVIGRCNKNVKNYFYDIEQKILRAYAKKQDAWITKGEEDGFQDIDGLFNDDKLERAIHGPVEDALKIGLRNLEYPTAETETIIARRMGKISGINDTARANVKERLKETLANSMKEGWTEDERAQNIMATIRDAMNINKNRAKTIARTEVHGAFSEGLWEGTKLAEPKYVMWVSSRDDRVRDSHADMDGIKVVPGEPFPNGLIYPMDPDGSAEEVINCRCTYVDIFDEKE